MKVKVRLSATRKFVVSLGEDTLGALKEHIRQFVRDTYHEDVREPLALSLNGKDALAGEDDTLLASLGVVQGDLLSVMQSDSGPQEAPPSARPQHAAAAAAPKEVPKESPKSEGEQKPPIPATASQPPAQAEGGRAAGSSGGEGSAWRRELLVEAVDGCAPPALEQLLGQCGPARLSSALNLVLHLTMLECGFQLDGVPHPPPGWAETVVVFPYLSAAHPDFRCKLVLMDVGHEKQVMASFPEQAGEVKHSLVMEDHLKGSTSGQVAAKDLVGVAQLSRRLRDAVLLPLQVAAHQALGVPAPWHLAGLPQELVLAVAMRLDYRSVIALANTCRRLKTVLADNRLWHDLFKRDFGHEAGSAGEAEWRDRYREAVQRQKEREKLLKEGTFVIPGMYPTGPYLPPHRPGHPNPFVPHPWGPGPFPPQPNPNPFMDPDSPYFPGEIPPVPGVYPDVPDPLGPLGPIRPGHPHQPPFMPPGRPRNPRGPRFDFFL